MSNGSNKSVHPSCTDQPPLAIDIIVTPLLAHHTDLDIFGLILYSMLTFMALMSMLVFLEECVIGTMSCLAMWIPRATMFTDMTSAWWVPAPGSLPLLCRHFGTRGLGFFP
ncbi:unnamed protein product [Tetraodon nigroviridis]|uniref:(spotted green pufferfish) hypothetical protein n=1 Tax=Tetraodon nigroviridis TaxID=99883 RepID=Q4SMY7_TETNG|nr:unnamed protein product [Tetraodon nigroviridis]